MGYEVIVKLTCENKDCDNQIIIREYGNKFNEIIKNLKQRFKENNIIPLIPLCKKCLTKNKDVV